MSDIRMTTSMEALDKLFAQAQAILVERVTYNLNYLGMTCVKRIRDREGSESWYDQTGNLRSSIGYAIYSEGRKQMESAFAPITEFRRKSGEKVKSGSSASEGSEKGRKMIDELATKYSDTYALVVIAAMEYAEFVEAIEGKDVLASTEIFAKKEVGRYLQKAIREAEKRIQALEVKL